MPVPTHPSDNTRINAPRLQAPRPISLSQTRERPVNSALFDNLMSLATSLPKVDMVGGIRNWMTRTFPGGYSQPGGIGFTTQFSGGYGVGPYKADYVYGMVNIDMLLGAAGGFGPGPFDKSGLNKAWALHYAKESYQEFNVIRSPMYTESHTWKTLNDLNAYRNRQRNQSKSTPGIPDFIAKGMKRNTFRRELATGEESIDYPSSSDKKPVPPESWSKAEKVSLDTAVVRAVFEVDIYSGPGYLYRGHKVYSDDTVKSWSGIGDTLLTRKTSLTASGRIMKEEIIPHASRYYSVGNKNAKIIKLLDVKFKRIEE